MNLNKEFTQGIRFGDRYFPYPGTAKEFAEFLGVPSVRALGQMSFADLEALPKVKEMGLVPIGGFRKFGETCFKWETTKAGCNWRSHEVIIGSAHDYHEAALRGLLTFWELCMYRKGRRD